MDKQAHKQTQTQNKTQGNGSGTLEAIHLVLVLYSVAVGQGWWLTVAASWAWVAIGFTVLGVGLGWANIYLSGAHKPRYYPTGPLGWVCDVARWMAFLWCGWFVTGCAWLLACLLVNWLAREQDKREALAQQPTDSPTPYAGDFWQAGKGWAGPQDQAPGQQDHRLTVDVWCVTTATNAGPSPHVLVPPQDYILQGTTVIALKEYLLPPSTVFLVISSGGRVLVELMAIIQDGTDAKLIARDAEMYIQGVNAADYEARPLPGPIVWDELNEEDAIQWPEDLGRQDWEH